VVVDSAPVWLLAAQPVPELLDSGLASLLLVGPSLAVSRPVSLFGAELSAELSAAQLLPRPSSADHPQPSVAELPVEFSAELPVELSAEPPAELAAQLAVELAVALLDHAQDRRLRGHPLDRPLDRPQDPLLDPLQVAPVEAPERLIAAGASLYLAAAAVQTSKTPSWTTLAPIGIPRPARRARESHTS
jgi:hypothetical protein